MISTKGSTREDAAAADRDGPGIGQILAVGGDLSGKGDPSFDEVVPPGIRVRTIGTTTD
jgi:hypothetical protein